MQEPEVCVIVGCRYEPARSYGLQVCQVHAHEIAEKWCAATTTSKLRSGPVVKRQRTEAARVEGGWIYYIQIGDRIKVGHTVNLQSRLSSYPPDMRLLAVEPGTRADEQAFHQTYQSYCVAGREWYARHGVILERIAAVIAEHGEPDWQPARRGRPKQAVAVRGRNGGRYSRT